MEKCKDRYEYGEGVTYQAIMSKAQRKYQARVMSNDCNTLTTKQQQIIALKAKIASINSFDPNKEHSTKHKKTNNKSDLPVQ
jgi:hypothetical protein